MAGIARFQSDYTSYITRAGSCAMMTSSTWWRHQMETFSALLAICAGNSPVPGDFPTQRPVTRSFDVYFDLRPNKWLSKQSWGWWFETLSCSLWRHRNEIETLYPLLAFLREIRRSPRWTPLTKASDAELWSFLSSAPEKNGCAYNRDNH